MVIVGPPLTGVVTITGLDLVSLAGARGCLNTLLSASSWYFSFFVSFFDGLSVLDGELLVAIYVNSGEAKSKLWSEKTVNEGSIKSEAENESNLSIIDSKFLSPLFLCLALSLLL